MPTIRTIAGALRHEIPKIKGSRFIASIAPVSSPEAASVFLESLREEFRDATHNCYAWRVGSDENAFRAGDDGEPSGTAGRPILQQIDGRRLTDVAVVVTRYYGGTKLGTGGLVRAYGEAASAALDLAEVVEEALTRSLQLRYGYELTGAVRGVLTRFGVEPSSSDFGAEVAATVAVPVESVEELESALRDATQGRLEISSE